MLRFHYGYAERERIDRNETCLADYTCCGAVIRTSDRICPHCREEVFAFITGIRNPQTQKWRWQITIGTGLNQPEILLSCAYCELEVVSRERQCARCGAFCFVEPRMGYEGESKWDSPPKIELHREVSADPVRYDEMPAGVKVTLAEPGTFQSGRPIHFDTSNLNLFLDWLLCPGFHTFEDRRTLDDQNRCLGHTLEISAVLVRRDLQVFVERRVFDYTRQREYTPDRILRKPLVCPACDDPITDIGLRCVSCQVIVDVHLVRKPQKKPSGTVIATYTAVEILLRHITEVVRPAECIPKVGDGWTDNQAIVSEPEPKQDRYALYLEIKKRRRTQTFEQISKALGMSIGSIQHILNNPPKRPTD